MSKCQQLLPATKITLANNSKKISRVLDCLRPNVNVYGHLLFEDIIF